MLSKVYGLIKMTTLKEACSHLNIHIHTLDSFLAFCPKLIFNYN